MACELNADDDEADCEINYTISQGTRSSQTELETIRRFSKDLIAATVTAGADALEGGGGGDETSSSSGGAQLFTPDSDDEDAAPRMACQTALVAVAAVMGGLLLL